MASDQWRGLPRVSGNGPGRVRADVEPHGSGQLERLGKFGAADRPDGDGAHVNHRREELDRLIAAASRFACNVLLVGETGSGKEVVAREIHLRSDRRAGPFVAADCTTLSATLIESLLFGHERGAFTGAVHASKGLARAADGGTLFLDEIGELPAEGQAKLLRLLQERVVMPVGATAPIRVDVRIIAATHRDLWSMVPVHRFREDLLYRLEVLRITLSPLRERLGELPRLTQELLERIAATHGMPPLSISPDAETCLAGHSWPGNVRELGNCLERAAILSPDGIIRPEHLPPQIAGAGVTTPRRFREELWQREEVALRDALNRAKGNKALAATLLGIHRKQLYRMLERHSPPTATA